jgi:hypothetical protein
MRIFPTKQNVCSISFSTTESVVLSVLVIFAFVAESGSANGRSAASVDCLRHQRRPHARRCSRHAGREWTGTFPSVQLGQAPARQRRQQSVHQLVAAREAFIGVGRPMREVMFAFNLYDWDGYLYPQGGLGWVFSSFAVRRIWVNSTDYHNICVGHSQTMLRCLLLKSIGINVTDDCSPSLGRSVRPMDGS